ncbi:carboxymuconolactone decarboxylase family protein [Vibrio harveyi]|uniref:carboxymuconolactone decarboxylase family protein n=1 Tax=Vibrio harveyi TaxID=669 RepID=UPI0036F32DAB
MSRFDPVRKSNCNQTQELFLNLIGEKYGRVPNFFATIAHSPVTAASFTNHSQTLGEQSSLTTEEIEAIALSQAVYHGCPYCTSAHSNIAKNKGVSKDEIYSFMNFTSSSNKIQQLIKFTNAINVNRGKVNTDDIERFLSSGYSIQNMVDVVAIIAINVFTNYTNLIFETDVDFPSISSIDQD